MHIDVIGDVNELVELGATVLRNPDDDIDWHILADVEGNRVLRGWAPAVKLALQAGWSEGSYNCPSRLRTVPRESS